MDAAELLSRDELTLLDTAISTMPVSLHDRTALLLLLHGIAPVHVCALLRSDFSPSQPGFPAQVISPRADTEEVIILSPPAETAVTTLLASHDSFRILPSMVPIRLKNLFNQARRTAGVRNVPVSVLRPSVRTVTLGETA